MIICDMTALEAGTAKMNQQERQDKKIHELRHLAIMLHENHCVDGEECQWKFEDWFNLEINHHKAEFFDKAEKVYNYFGQDFQATKKFIELLETCPKAARIFFQHLQ